jgi:hypothetical protein
MKKCTKCKETKDESHFGNHKQRPDGLRRECKDCSRKIKQTAYQNAPHKAWEADIKHNYGCTIEQYNQMFSDQGGRCVGCGVHQSDMLKRLSIDHCHKTNKIRGLLCNNCNVALGWAQDNVNILMNLANYVEKNK